MLLVIMDRGKTNLIEAIHLLSTAKSFRTAKTNDLLNWHYPEAFIRTTYQNNLTENKLELILNKQKKYIFNDNKLKSVVDFIGQIKVVCFAPHDLNLIQGAPSVRRKFMDRHTVDLDSNFLAVLFDYNRALKSKNQLLKNSNPSLNDILPWNRILAEKSQIIIEQRQKLINSLLGIINQVHSSFAEADGEVGLRLKSELINSDQQLMSIEEISDRYDACFDRERVMRKTLLGPQHDDLEIFYAGHAAGSFASQGQSRSLTLSLKFAVLSLLENQQEDAPILLLDDLDSELDDTRIYSLYNFLNNKNLQVFITGTKVNEGLMHGLQQEINYYQINAGEIINKEANKACVLPLILNLSLCTGRPK